MFSVPSSAPTGLISASKAPSHDAEQVDRLKTS